MLNPTYVTSSNISAVAHDGTNMFILFKSGKTYMYKDVPHASFQALVTAESVGQHYHRFIKNQFEYVANVPTPFPVITPVPFEEGQIMA